MLFFPLFSPGGALKPTDVDSLWVHVTCAWFQPEVSFASDEKMEPALGILCIPSNSFVKVEYHEYSIKLLWIFAWGLVFVLWRRYCNFIVIYTCTRNYFPTIFVSFWSKLRNTWNFYWWNGRICWKMFAICLLVRPIKWPFFTLSSLFSSFKVVEWLYFGLVAFSFLCYWLHVYFSHCHGFAMFSSF